MFRELRYWSPGGGAQIFFPPFNKAARVVAITVGIVTSGGAAARCRWTVLSQDALVSTPLMVAEGMPSASSAVPATVYFSFLVNQQRAVPIADPAEMTEFSPGFLPPDLWLKPGERVQLDITEGGVAAVFTDAFLSVLVPWTDELPSALEAARSNAPAPKAAKKRRR